MEEFDVDIICVHLGSVGQVFSDFTELGNVATRFPIAANPVVCIN